MGSFKAEFKVGGQWYDNALRFEHESEAKRYGEDKFMVWTMPTDHRTVPSPDAPTHTCDLASGEVRAIR